MRPRLPKEYKLSDGLTRRGTFGLAAFAGIPYVSWPFGARELGKSDRILVNQIGYPTQAPKVILIHSPKEIDTGDYHFDVLEAESGTQVGKLTTELQWTTNDKVATANISDLTRPGRYVLKSGKAVSVPFVVTDEPYGELMRSLLRAFYLQRCGVALSDPLTGLSHAACHTRDALSDDHNAYKDRSGGWHDAGDFGKYVASTSVALGELLSLYEQHPDRFAADDLGIPESGDGVPDILSEARVGLRWLLKMQTPYGAFERKVAGREWPSMTNPPEEDDQERFAFGVSTGDTAKAGAALALASRIFKPFNEEEAALYLKAAREAEKFLHYNPTPRIDREQSDDAGSGAYFDETKKDQDWDAGDRIWFAAELFMTTGDRVVGRDFARRVRRHYLWSASWADTSAIGMLNYLINKRVTDIGDTKAHIRERLAERADEFEKTSRLAPWQTADLDFGWGSNRDLAARGRVLIAAYERTGERRFLRAALAQVNYILGSNPKAISYVSGFGTASASNIHNRLLLNARTKDPAFKLPGLLVGGANADADNPLLRDEKGVNRYIDDPAAYETNEFALDHNAALLALLGRIRVMPEEEEEGFLGRMRGRIGF